MTMTSDENARKLGDEICRQIEYMPIVSTHNLMIHIRDNATVRGIMREWLRRLEDSVGGVDIVKRVETRWVVVKVSRDGAFCFDEVWRSIRSKAKYKGSACFRCNSRFSDGQGMALAITNRGNRVVCHECAAELREALIKKEAGK